jgi:hypothetical protein
MRATRVSPACCLVAALAAWGCGPLRPARLVPPALDVATIAAGIMQADANGDDELDAGELAKAPAFVAAVGVLDRDGDKALSRAELKSWLSDIRSSKVAIHSAAVVVKHKGRPLAEAAVKFVPEPFMGAAAAPAGGTTDAAGQAGITIPGSRYPGINCGVYRIEISGSGNDGRPLASRYNASSTLGAAVGGELPVDGVFLFTLE